MTIKFICTCGKHLKARDEMAARRSVCPRCGSPVGIPSLKPTHLGTVAAPMSPPERLRHARQRQPVPLPTPAPETAVVPAPRPADPRLVRLLSSRAERPPTPVGRHLEHHWYECLLYPLRAWRLCLGLAMLLTGESVAAAMLLPHLLAQPPTNALMLAAMRGSCLLLLVPIVGLPCSFLECVLASAASGEVYFILWSGSPLLVVLRSGLKWLACFLAGPVVFATAGWVYWLRCGDPSPLDWSILTELGVVAVAYWVCALLALTDRGRLRDLNPLRVADLAHRLGWRGVVVVLAAGLLLLAHGWLLATGVATVHTLPAQGLMLLVGVWLSGMYWSTYFCRLLGVWCYRTRPGDDV